MWLGWPAKAVMMQVGVENQKGWFTRVMVVLQSLSLAHAITAPLEEPVPPPALGEDATASEKSEHSKVKEFNARMETYAAFLADDRKCRGLGNVSTNAWSWRVAFSVPLLKKDAKEKSARSAAAPAKKASAMSARSCYEFAC